MKLIREYNRDSNLYEYSINYSKDKKLSKYFEKKLNKKYFDSIEIIADISGITYITDIYYNNNEIKDIQKHINKEIKQVKQCLGK